MSIVFENLKQGEVDVKDARDMLSDSELYEVFNDKMLKAFSNRKFVKFYMEQSAMSFNETGKSGSREGVR